jgi:hypothetical protein
VHLAGASAVYTDEVINLLNDKFVPFAQTWRGPHEKWFSEAQARFWKNWAADEKNVTAGQVRVGSGWVLGSQFVVTTSAGCSLSSRVGRDGAAQALKNILEAYAKLPEAERRASAVEGEAKPMPAPPPGGVVLTTYDRPLVRDADGRYRLPIGGDINSDARRLAAPAGQRSTLWLTEDECKSLIPQDPRKGDTIQVPAKLAKRIFLFGLWPQSLWVVEGAWLPNSVREGQIKVTVEEVTEQTVRMHLSGAVLLVGKNGHTKEVKEGEIRYDARLEGVLVYDRGEKRITRWDMAALGDYTGEWFAEDGKRWREATPDAPLRLGVAFELDRSDYDFPERRRPRGFVHGYIFAGDRPGHEAQEQYYWDPEKWEANWKKKQ